MVIIWYVMNTLPVIYVHAPAKQTEIMEKQDFADKRIKSESAEHLFTIGRNHVFQEKTARVQCFFRGVHCFVAIVRIISSAIWARG